MPLSAQPPDDAPDPVEHLEDLYENAPCGYLSLRTDGRIFGANATSGKWLGMSGPDLVGKQFPELLGMAGRIYYKTHFATMVALRGHLDEVALDMVTASGTRVPMLVNAVAKTAPDGEHLFIRLTLFKATERRKYERSLRDSERSSEMARRELHTLHAQVEEILLDKRETSALREEFIGVLCHDLRNPAAAVTAGISLLLRDGIAGERRKAVGQMVGQSVDHMAALVDDVMDLTRGRLGGGITLRWDAAEPLAPVLRHVVGELMTASPERDIEVQVAIDEPVNCDRRRIAQAVSNLVANALTHGAASTPPHPLTAEDNREEFDCGRESLSLWFCRHARCNPQSGASRTSVLANVASGSIVG